MAVKDLRDSNKITTKNANAKQDASLSESKKNMPCKKSVPT